MVKPIIPCIWLDNQAEQAAAFYTKTLPDGRIIATSHYPESSDNPSGKPRGSTLTVEFEVLGQRFTALNGGPIFSVNPSISFFVTVKTPADADKLFAALVEGGDVLMPLGKYPWSERYGWLKDRFGVTWQIMTGNDEAKIAPLLMFTGQQHGKTEEAMRLYTSIFPNGKIDSSIHYAEGEGPVDTVKQGRFIVDGQVMRAMDSDAKHGFTFNEGLSLQVMCKDQPEVDRYWEALSEGGEKGPCGWLKDRFGVSWQIVPEDIRKWMASNDVAARDRAFAAMMTMKKPDIAALEAAFDARH